MTENKYFTSLSEKSWNKMIKNAEFHGSFNDVVTIDERRTGLHLIKQIRMITHLLELHENIQKLNSVFASIPISRNNILVKLLLELGQSYIHKNLFFSRQALFDVRLESPQHKWLKQPMNLFDDLLLLLLIILSFIVKYEEIIEVLRRFE